MPSDAVVKYFDVFEEALTRLRPGLIPFAVNGFLLEGCKEAFHWRVVPAVSFSAHGTGDVVLFPQRLVMIAGILHAAI